MNRLQNTPDVTLRTSNPNPIDVLLVIKGGREQEGDLHAKFQKYRIQGEWYKADRSILEMVDELELTKGSS